MNRRATQHNRNRWPKVRREFPLRLILIAPFILQIIAAVGLTGYLSLRNGQTAVNDLARQLHREAGARIEEQLDTYLTTARVISKTNQDAINLGLFNVSDTERLGRHFWQQVQSANIGYVIMGLKSGQFLAVGHFYGDERVTVDEVNLEKHQDYHLHIYETDQQGKRTKVLLDGGDMYVDGKFVLHQEGWYTEVMQRQASVWTPVYNWAVEPFPLAIATSRPIYDQNQNLIGIIAVEQQLSQISDFLKQLQVSPNGKVVIMERSGLLVASSSDEQPFTVEEGKPNRLRAADSQDRSIQATISYLDQNFGGFKTIQSTQQLNFMIDGKRQFVQVTPWQDKLGLDWLVVVTVPESDFMGQIYANQYSTILLCLGALGVAIVLGILTSRWIAHPILKLSQASQAITAGDFQQSVNISGVTELRTLSQSFNHMARQLQSSFTALQSANADLELHTDQLSTANRALQCEIVERQLVEEQLRHGALHDALTGCPNRACLMEHLELALRRSQRQADYLFAVLFIDMDRFKVVNDSLGHQIGDQLLIAIVQQLKTVVRATDTVARLGGDEFVILLDPIDDLQNAVRIVDRIHQAFKSPIELNGRQVFTTASIGIALSDRSYVQADDLLRDADIAMYRAKADGTAQYEVFNKEMYTQALGRLHLENDLRQAIEKEEFQVYYQPIIDLSTERLAGFEALCRWHHPVEGWISPAQFIAAAEETGLIVYLGEYVLRTACQHMAVWQTAVSPQSPLSISVNLSARQLKTPGFLESIDRILAQTGLREQQLHLELTESMLMENVDELTHILGQLRARKIQLSIDDFGTGYSSLSYLHRFPINTLKIDRSFVSRMGQRGESQDIVETMINLAHQLGMVAIAEGVELQQQADHLRHLGCEKAQGYLFAKPLPPEAAMNFIVRQGHYCDRVAR